MNACPILTVAHSHKAGICFRPTADSRCRRTDHGRQALRPAGSDPMAPIVGLGYPSVMIFGNLDSTSQPQPALSCRFK